MDDPASSSNGEDGLRRGEPTEKSEQVPNNLDTILTFLTKAGRENTRTTIYNAFKKRKTLLSSSWCNRMSFRTSVTKVEPPWQPLRQSTGTLPQGNTDTDSNALVTSLGICGKDRHEVGCLSVWSSGLLSTEKNSKCAGVLVLMGPDCSSPEQNTFSLQDVAGEHFQPPEPCTSS